MAAVLADTNLLLYAHDSSNPVKQRTAIEVLAHLHASGSGRLSSQTLAEFFAAATRGARPLLSIARASQQVENFAASWIVFQLSPFIVIEAVRGVRAHQFSYWDSQIWATARLNQVPVVFTEDFNAGSTKAGVRFVNPFSDDFKLSDWL
jgi:predicted nucleic acid-binding protein